MLSYQHNLKNSYTERKAKHDPSGWAMFTKCSFDATKNKIDYYRGIDCIKMLCKNIKDHALKIINYEKKEMIPLSEEENKSYEEQEVCHICKKKFYLDENDENESNENENNENESDKNENENENDKNEKYRKVKDHCHYTRKFRGAAHSDYNLRYKVPKNIPIIIHNAGYDTHFIINQLAEEFKSEFECIGENM